MAEKKLTQPSDILSYVSKSIKTTLKQKSESKTIRDGMDIALCSYDLNLNQLTYAGANRPMWLFRRTLEETIFIEKKPTKHALAGHTPDDCIFENHVIDLIKGDTIYVFSDGFADQFGGEKGKKMMTKRMQNIIHSIQDLSMQDQELYLQTFFEKWVGNREQLDDVLIIGIKI